MAKLGLDTILRHESTDEEELFGERESRVISAPPAVKKVRPFKGEGKGKRSVEDMMAGMATNPMAQSLYALERVATYEDRIEETLKLCSKESLELVLKQRPSLRRYAPDGDE